MKTNLLLFIVGLNLFVSEANANSCHAMMDDLIAYATKTNQTIFHPGHYNIVKVKMTTNRPDNRYVSYAEGTMKKLEVFLNRPRLPPILIKSELSGNTRQSFSDRFDYLSGSCNPGELCPGYSQQFSAKKTDSLDMNIDRDGGVRFVLKSWGNTAISFAGTCANNMLTGSTPDGTLYVLSFAKETQSGEPA